MPTEGGERQGSGLGADRPGVGRHRGQVKRRGRGQDGSGRARNRARALLNRFCQGQSWGRCKVRRRALRVSLPAKAKQRRRRVLVVDTGSPRPMRVVQRARLWAITWTASQAALAAKRPEGRWLSPTPYLRACPALDAGSPMAFSISAWPGPLVGLGRPPDPACRHLGR